MSRIKTLLLAAAVAACVGIFSLAVMSPTHAAASNTYPYGQCTYYAKSQRPDVGNYWGDARFWASAARRAGFAVDGRPRVGDVVVLGRYVQGNSPYGHVGIVAAVKGSQFLTVSMWGNEATGRIHVNWHYTGYGVSFIHKQIYATSYTSKPAAKAAPVKHAPVKAAPIKHAPVKAAPIKAPTKAAPVKVKH